jgi:hypothetical protein
VVKKYLLTIIALSFLTELTLAREPGHYVPGIANIRDQVVPAQAGFYYEQYNAFYSTDTYRDKNGDPVDSLSVGPLTIPVEADVDVSVISPLFLWVTEKEIWGANYAFYVAPVISKASVSASVSALNRDLQFDDSNTGVGDTFVQPLWLGWRDASYDLSLGLGLYLPTGEYDVNNDDNIGLGFWTLQTQVAGYYYLDDLQASALMATLTYETHDEKEDTDITPGDHMTLELGFSQYLSQRLEVGVHAFRQWQTEGDDGAAVLDPRVKPEIYGYGLQLAYWVTPRLNISLKYLAETDAEARFEGDWTVLNFTYLPGPLY